MSNDLNNCYFIGRLSRDPETRYLPSGEAVASFSLAVGSTWKDKQGQKQESTEWVNVTAFGKLAEICTQYLAKGSRVYLSGRMKTDKYNDKEGITRYSTKIIADRMQMLGGKTEKQDGIENQRKASAAATEAQRPASGGGFDDLEDQGLPF